MVRNFLNLLKVSMKKNLFKWSGVAVVLTPLLALAQTGTGNAPISCSNFVQPGNLEYILCKLNDILGMVLPFLIALAVVIFVWGVVMYVVSSDEEAKATGRTRMIWGIVGLAVIIGLWGLVKIITNTFGLNNTQQIDLPTVDY